MPPGDLLLPVQVQRGGEVQGHPGPQSLAEKLRYPLVGLTMLIYCVLRSAVNYLVPNLITNYS